MPEVYRAAAVSTGDGRNGHSRSTDGMVDVDLATGSLSVTSDTALDAAAVRAAVEEAGYQVAAG